MSEFAWYRKLRGGYWVKWFIIGWQRTDKDTFERVKRERLNRPPNSFESY